MIVALLVFPHKAESRPHVIKGERGSGVLGINGAAAHLVHPGDLVILISYGQMDDAEAATYEPRVVFVDADNRIVHRHTDPGHAPEGSGLLSGTVTLPLDEETAVFPVAETADARRLDALLHAES